MQIFSVQKKLKKVQKNSIYLREIFCNIINVFTVTFDQFKGTLCNFFFCSKLTKIKCDSIHHQSFFQNVFPSYPNSLCQAYYVYILELSGWFSLENAYFVHSLLRDLSYS